MNLILDFRNLSGEQTKELNCISVNVQQKFVNLIDNLSKEYLNIDNWWYSSLVSRNIMQNDAYIDICKFALAKKYIVNYNSKVIVDKYCIYCDLKKNFPLANIVLKENIKTKCKRHFLRLFGFVRKKRFFNRINYIKKYINNIDNVSYDKCQIIVDTFLIPQEFKNGKYKDRYFNGLTQNNETDFLFFSSIVYNRKKDVNIIFKEIGTIKNLISYEKYAKKSDFLEINKYVKWCYKFKINNAIIDDLDVSNIINEAIRYGVEDLTTFTGIVKGNVLSRLLGSNSQIKKYICWYEGQSSSNVIYSKIRKEFNITTIAYCTSPYMENNIGQFPFETQYKQQKTAEIFGSQGSAWDNYILQFVNDVKIIRAPSFRYNSMYSLPKYGNARNGILIVLPGDIKSACSFLNKLFSVVDIEKYGKIYIKNHPIFDGYNLYDYGIKNIKYDFVEFVTGNLLELANSVLKVIVCETTGLIETLLMCNTLALYVPSGRFLETCIPVQYKHLISILYESKDFVDFLESQNNTFDEKIKQNLVEECFTPVNADTIKNFIS